MSHKHTRNFRMGFVSCKMYNNELDEFWEKRKTFSLFTFTIIFNLWCDKSSADRSPGRKHFSSVFTLLLSFLFIDCVMSLFLLGQNFVFLCMLNSSKFSLFRIFVRIKTSREEEQPIFLTLNEWYFYDLILETFQWELVKCMKNDWKTFECAEFNDASGEREMSERGWIEFHWSSSRACFIYEKTSFHWNELFDFTRRLKIEKLNKLAFPFVSNHSSNAISKKRKVFHFSCSFPLMPESIRLELVEYSVEYRCDARSSRKQGGQVKRTFWVYILTRSNFKISHREERGEQKKLKISHRNHQHQSKAN